MSLYITRELAAIDAAVPNAVITSVPVRVALIDVTVETIAVDVWSATELASDPIAAAGRGNTVAKDLIPAVQMMVVVKEDECSRGKRPLGL